MSQATLNDEDLFSEAASEMRTDVEDSLDAAEAALPDVGDIWNVESENTLGVLNGLNAALDPGEAAEHLRDAKKWYTMGHEADAFDDAEDLAARIEILEELITDIDSASEHAGALSSTIPALKNRLEDAEQPVAAD